MTREEHLLARVAEECGEVAQRAMKAQEFGLQESQKGDYESNEQRLIKEFNDLYAVMQILHEDGYIGEILIKGHVEYKRERIEKYLEYAKTIGKLK